MDLRSFKTILVFCSIYVVGMIACTMAAHPIWVGWTQPVFFIGNHIWMVFLSCDASLRLPRAFLFTMSGLYVGVTTGSGGIKPNVVVLGADQVRCARLLFLWKHRCCFKKWNYCLKKKKNPCLHHARHFNGPRDHRRVLAQIHESQLPPLSNSKPEF